MDFFELISKFSTEREAITHYVMIRYSGKLKCPHCGSETHLYRYRKRSRFVQCKKCNKTFSIFTGTIFEKTRTDIRKWFFAIHLFLNAKKGISGYQLQREIKVTYKTAWRMLNKIREAMGNVKEQRLFQGVVEVDETYVGGRPRRIYDGPRRVNKRGRGTKKIPVFGIKERSTGTMYAKVMEPNENGKKLTGKQLLSVIDEKCDYDTIVMTDDFTGYNILDRKTEKRFKRLVVNHSIGQYSVGNGVHTNGIENFWSIFKRGWYGIYHRISTKYLQNYVDEYCFRNNHRKNKDSFDVLLKQALLKEPKKKCA